MVSFKIEIRSSARRDAKKLDPPIVARILVAIRSLQDDPFPAQHKKLRDAENKYRLRVGDYRVLYRVDLDARLVVVEHIRHRRDAYRK